MTALCVASHILDCRLQSAPDLQLTTALIRTEGADEQ